MTRRSRGSHPATPKLYGQLAPWFHLLTAPEDYAEEAAVYGQTIIDACDQAPLTLLELGSGGGNNASHLKGRFRTTLVDLSPDMLELSQALNPECEHLEGDMRSVRLNREFDVVLCHDAISYMTTKDDLRSALETTFVHCRPGGAALFVPDCVRENFHAHTDHGGHDGNARSMRYLGWTWDPDPDDTTYITDYAYLLRGEDGTVRVEYDRHVLGLFARGDWLRLLSEVGFQPTVLPHELTAPTPWAIEMFLGMKSSG